MEGRLNKGNKKKGMIVALTLFLPRKPSMIAIRVESRGFEPVP